MLQYLGKMIFGGAVDENPNVDTEESSEEEPIEVNITESGGQILRSTDDSDILELKGWTAITESIDNKTMKITIGVAETTIKVQINGVYRYFRTCSSNAIYVNTEESKIVVVSSVNGKGTIISYGTVEGSYLSPTFCSGAYFALIYSRCDNLKELFELLSINPVNKADSDNAARQIRSLIGVNGLLWYKSKQCSIFAQRVGKGIVCFGVYGDGSTGSITVKCCEDSRWIMYEKRFKYGYEFPILKNGKSLTWYIRSVNPQHYRVGQRICSNSILIGPAGFNMVLCAAYMMGKDFNAFPEVTLIVQQAKQEKKKPKAKSTNMNYVTSSNRNQHYKKRSAYLKRQQCGSSDDKSGKVIPVTATKSWADYTDDE